MKASVRMPLQKQLTPPLLAAFGVVGSLLLGTLDYATPVQMRFTLLYCLGIVFVSWRGGLVAGLWTALASTAAVAVDQPGLGGETPYGTWVLAWDIISQGTVFSALAWLAARISGLTRHLGNLVEERKSQYEAILASAMDGFAAVRSDGQVVDVNDSFCQLLGFARQELLGKNVADLESSADPGRLARPDSGVSRQGSDRFETRLRHRDGSDIHAEISISPVRGKSDLVVAFAREIGERKHAEARLRESEERYRRLAETSPDMIFVLDRQLHILYANSAAAARWGHPPGELLGLSQTDLFSTDDAERHARIAVRVLDGSQVHRFDERITFPSGSGWFDTRLVPVNAPDGKTTSLIVISVDISERKRTEFLLQAQKNLGNVLSLTSDLPTALQALLDVALTFEGVDSGGVYLRDPASGDLALAAHAGKLPPEFIARASYYPASSDRAKLVSQGTPVYGHYSSLPQDPLDARSQLKLQGIAVVPLTHEGLVIGSLNLGSHLASSFPPQTRIGIELIATQAAGAIARIRAETERQRLQGQILEISDREQARIGQEIHDGLCQQLVSLAFDANALGRDLARSSGPRAAVAARISDGLDQAITDARRLSRGLFPIRLEGEGLLSALEELAASTRSRSGVECCFQPPDSRLVLSSTVATHLFRIAQEAVNNALKHGRPASIFIRLQARAEDVTLVVEDDGCGLGMRPSHSRHGMGLHIMDYRARSMGGRFQTGACATGGTRISCCVPGT